VLIFFWVDVAEFAAKNSCAEENQKSQRELPFWAETQQSVFRLLHKGDYKVLFKHFYTEIIIYFN
jgi:hypothetical protein